MPLIKVPIENVFNPEQKHQMIQLVIDAIVSIEGENMCGGSRFRKSRAANGASAASL